MFTTLYPKALVAVGLLGALSIAAVAQYTGSSTSRGQAASNGPGVDVKVRGSVEQTLGELKRIAADNGMMVMGELHQGKVLAMTGLRVNSETVFVGNPNVGKQLFSQEPGVGLIVPVRINIYEDARGQAHVRYIPTSQQLDTFGNSRVSEIARMLDAKLRNMTQMLQ